MNLVFLHGGMASGKLTLARELGGRLGYAVFHNHLVVDAVASVFPFGTAPFVKLRERFWLDMIEEAVRSGIPTIFTFAPEPTVEAGFPERVRGAVERHGGRIHFVELDVTPAEQERRLGMPSRREFGKLTDVEILRRLRTQESSIEHPPSDLIIETDRTPPSEAAELIIEALALEPVGAEARDPD